jgi:peptidoglycan/LPS O-acetylase OafA/YrhL
MKIHLKGLNGLRAIAAIAVLMDHINGGLNYFDLDVHSKMDLAGYGVTIFFSLSGFLITYLLFLEQELGSISIKNFYIRRILRIWPLYFLLLFVAITIEGTEDVLYYIFFVPNLPYVFGGGILLLGHYWSLGIEEQFYLFWPWCIKYLRHSLRFLIVFTLVSVLLKLILKYVYGGWSTNYEFLYQLRFDCMAIGGIGAWLIVNRNKIIESPYFSYAVILSWIIFGFVAFNSFHTFSIIDHEIVALATVILILDQAFGKQFIFNLERPWLNYIGKISYGIYMINPFVIFFLPYLIKDMHINLYLKYTIVYLSSVLGTILLSHLSYYFFEMPILTLKQRFGKIISTN